MNAENMTQRERELLEYLRRALPVADQISLSDDQLLKVVRHALAVRAQTPWGESIPESVFRAFVVFPRVNNENAVFYHETLWEILKPRIEGMSLYEAVVEINYWCCEVATYQLTDNRTANALTVLRRAYGRCGEESMLLVSALRAAGIPARQIYVPRWAHCDDNHAWVEAWVDGKWYYLGACEPEPVLDSGWFTSAASKSMLVHTRCYGLEPEGERVETHVGRAAIINRIGDYANSRLLTVRVTENGQPKSGLTVHFGMANEAEFIPISSQQTDADGTVTLLTGYGTIHLHIHDGHRYLALMADLCAQDRYDLDFGKAVEFVREEEMFDHRPPMETRIQPGEFPEEIAEKHRLRLKQCDELRAAREATFSTENEYFRNARGNHPELRHFLGDARFAEEDKKALLDTLREKDFVDFEAETLVDALENALPYKNVYPYDIWQQGVLCPRVRDEMIYPVRAFFRDQVKVEANAQAIWKLLSDRTELCEMDPVTLTPDPRAVWISAKASEPVLDVTFVAVARSLGVAARLNPATGEKEYYDDGWKALVPARQMDAKLVLVNPTGRELIYSNHFTVSRLENGEFKALEMYGTPLKERMEIPVLAGQYRVMTCTRQIDGCIDGWLLPVEVAAGETVEVTMKMREDRTAQKLYHAALPKMTTRTKALPEDGVRTILAVIDPGAEPTEHFLNELIEAKEELKEERLAVRLVIDRDEQANNEKLQKVLRELSDVELLVGPDHAALLEWRRLLYAGDLRLPFAMAADEKGEGLFAYVNYHVGSVRSLLRIATAGK